MHAVIEGCASTVVDATPEQVIAFVLELDTYRQADHKIRSFRLLHGDARHGHVVLTGRLRGLPTPPDRQAYEVSADGCAVDFRSVPSRWPGLLASFHGSVRCQAAAGGTLVTHNERFTFSPALAWLVEPYLRTWLQRDTESEVKRIAAFLAHTT